jgi:hypothetical protein
MKAKNNQIVRGTRGKRLVIVHAITKDGWLRTALPLQTETVFMSTADVCDCEMLFDTDHTDGDYHKNMDNKKFMYWVKHRLFHTCAKLHSDRGVCLFLDNVAYHHRNQELNVKAIGSYTRKDQLVSQLRSPFRGWVI